MTPKFSKQHQELPRVRERHQFMQMRLLELRDNYLEARTLAAVAFLLLRWWVGELEVPGLPDFTSSECWLAGCLRFAGTFLALVPAESAASEFWGFLGGIRSLTRSRPLASSKDVMDWPIVTPLIAVCKEDAPPDSTPIGSMPDGVRPFSSNTVSLSFLRTENTRAIFPMARILFLITSLRAAGYPPYVKPIISINYLNLIFKKRTTMCYI